MHASLLVIGDNIEEQMKPFIDPFAFDSEPADYVRGPNAKYDYYSIGGNFRHMLELKHPRKEPYMFGLLKKEVTKTCSAKKSEINVESLLLHPPVSVLINGVWEDADFIIGQAPNEDWLKRFDEIFSSLPESAKLTILDYHT